MDQAKSAILEKKIEKTLANLRKNHMEAYYVATRGEVPALVARLLPEGASVSHGGSVTLEECGVTGLLREGGYRYLDRSACAPGSPEQEALYREIFSADAFVTSTNAVTEEGELLNVDGRANRIAAIAFGPRSVIVVAGINKLVPNLQAAMLRVQRVAAPANCVRLGCQTYCAEKGECAAIAAGKGGQLGAGCSGEGRICSNYLVCGPQVVRGRIQVILVGEELGY